MYILDLQFVITVPQNITKPLVNIWYRDKSLGNIQTQKVYMSQKLSMVLVLQSAIYLSALYKCQESDYLKSTQQ